MDGELTVKWRWALRRGDLARPTHVLVTMIPHITITGTLCMLVVVSHYDFYIPEHMNPHPRQDIAVPLCPAGDMC